MLLHMIIYCTDQAARCSTCGAVAVGCVQWVPPSTKPTDTLPAEAPGRYCCGQHMVKDIDAALTELERCPIHDRDDVN